MLAVIGAFLSLALFLTALPLTSSPCVMDHSFQRQGQQKMGTTPVDPWNLT